jgi:AraC-like DNA-binding protein
MDARTLKTGTHMHIDDASWRATIERIDIGAGLRVFLTDAEARHDITVEARDDRTDQWLGSQVTVTGRADIDFLDGQKTHATPAQALLFRASGRCAAYRLLAGAKFRSAGYGLDVARIARLFGGEVPHALSPLIAPQVNTSRIVPMRGSRLMRNLAASLFAPGLNGPLRALMMEGAVIQMLAVQAASVSNRPVSRASRTLSARERKAVHAAREQLLADMRRPPTLGELAWAAGLTEKRLNAGFRALFGATVFEVLRNERLDHARLALEDGRLALKAIAERVGYNHATNFINAFTARYGAPPRKYFTGGRPAAAARLPSARLLKHESNGKG